jgi:hypothetical protein
MWDEFFVVVDIFTSRVMFFHYAISFRDMQVEVAIVFKGHIEGSDETS